ncbi:type IV pilus modification PilV family protein [Planococcus sp. CAU13]|uniref:type IV pilus modification PilV family protein n=1 Tax=Planococcus sp. CAU13 TaxID=1541197 RepID=UPI00052FF7FD|nr:type II secretion system protein [Planococcus sp. CAU13]
MIKQLKNNDGLTLVEILAALVLLSIVLITFMSFFTQSAKFTASNEETLTAIQVAEDVVAKVRDIKAFEEIELFNNFEEGENDSYINKDSYYLYEVTVKKENRVDDLDLRRVTISVLSTSNRDIKNKAFNTEMYFEEKTP